jgi:hypothetical protein
VSMSASKLLEGSAGEPQLVLQTANSAPTNSPQVSQRQTLTLASNVTRRIGEKRMSRIKAAKTPPASVEPRATVQSFVSDRDHPARWST